VLSDCAGNVSEAARRLSIHRRSLQRKLGKKPPV
jgi:two-component system response regulator RegA